MAPIGPSHAWRVDFTSDYITRRLDERFIVRGQNPIHLDDASEPQPDMAIILRKSEGYASAHPTPADVLLVIEVADSSWNMTGISRPTSTAAPGCRKPGSRICPKTVLKDSRSRDQKGTPNTPSTIAGRR